MHARLIDPLPQRQVVEFAVTRPIDAVVGVDDATSVCGALASIGGVEVARVPGTHHFENGIPDVVDAATSRLFFREAP